MGIGLQGRGGCLDGCGWVSGAYEAEGAGGCLDGCGVGGGLV